MPYKYLPRQTVVHYCATQNFVEFLQDLTEMGASFEIADDKGKVLLNSVM